MNDLGHYDRRLSNLEQTHNAMQVTQQEMQVTQQGMQGQLAQLSGSMDVVGKNVEKLTGLIEQTSSRVGTSSNQVIAELRNEQDRKAADRKEMIQTGLAMIGAVALIVSALGGPYIGKLNEVAQDTRGNSGQLATISREIGKLSADVGRNKEQLEKLEGVGR